MRPIHEVSGSWENLELLATRFHAKNAGLAIHIWEEGFNLIHSNMSRLDGLIGHTDVRPELLLMSVVLDNSTNSLKCLRDLALKGYFLQAMNLARLPIEFSMVYMYLRLFPSAYEQFTNPDRKDPSFNDMLQKIEAVERHSDSRSDIRNFRSWIKIFTNFLTRNTRHSG